MGPGGWCVVLCTMVILAAPCRVVRRCMEGITINVILLDDEEFPWSLTYVKGKILQAIDIDSAINAAEGKEMT